MKAFFRAYHVVRMPANAGNETKEAYFMKFREFSNQLTKTIWDRVPYLPSRYVPLRFLELKAAMRSRETTPILVYHALSWGSENPLVADRIHNISPERFHSQLSLLKRHFSVLPLDELADLIKAGRLVRGLAAISFDDGYLPTLRTAAAVLRDLDIPATFFVATKLVETKTFWRDKIRYVINRGLVRDFLAFAKDCAPVFAYVHPDSFYSATKDPAIVNSKLAETVLDQFFEEYGMDVQGLTKDIYCSPEHLIREGSTNLTYGSHSHSHYVLSSMSKSEQYLEIETAQRILHDMGLLTSRVFSIPFGTPRDFNEDTVAILKDLDYLGYVLCAGKGGTDALGKNDGLHRSRDLVALRRFMPTENQSFLFGE